MMTPGQVQFQMFIPQAMLAGDGSEQWSVYAGADTIDELEHHARQQRIPRFLIVAVVPIKSFPPAGTVALSALRPSGVADA